MCELSPVTFHGDTIFCLDYQGQPFTPMKPIVENLGLGWASQSQKLNSNRERWGVTIIVIPSESGEQQMLCLPVRKLPSYLNSINPRKVAPELRERIELYQAESDDALWNYWMNGRAERPTPAPSPDAAISPAERAELKALVDAKLSAAPAAVQGKARAEIWTRFNRHFKIAEYAQLPAVKMPEARDYLIQMEVKALQPAAAALPAAQASAATEQPAAGQHMACLLLIEDVRERLRTTCHPGAVTMKMTPQERRVYYACHAAYVAADEALAGAYSILDAGRRMAEAIRA